MKNLYLFFVISILMLSCSNNDDTTNPVEEVFIPDSTIIAEYHVLNNTGEIRAKSIFDNNGLLHKYKNVTDDLTLIFHYDSENKIVAITKTNVEETTLGTFNPITYDANNKVTSIGTSDFTFDISKNEYIDDTSYSSNEYIGGNYYEQEINYSKYKLNEYGFANDICHLELIIITNLTTNETLEYPWCYDSSWSCTYDSNYNISYTFEGGDGVTSLNYDSLVNPLFNSNSNIRDIYALLKGTIYIQWFAMYRTIFRTLSNNNLVYIHWDDGVGPERDKYIYEFNGLELPVTTVREIYYFDILEDSYVSAKYYYQGDEIPE